MLHLQGAPTAAAHYMLPQTETGVWLHQLLPLATIRGAIVATDAGATHGDGHGTGV